MDLSGNQWWELILITVIVVLSGYALLVTWLWLKPEKSLVKAPKPASHDLSKQALIQIKADEAMRLHQTFQKFVPKQFVAHFAKEGTDTLELGHAAEDHVAVMFCDIRGFTSLSEQMSPQQLMNFLNAYFLRMNAPIHENNGFIDKFIGDAIMALFDNPDGEHAQKASDAIASAIGIQEALTLYNQHRHKVNYEPIRNGIGIHFGPVVIGTVGSDDRMDTTVIGDTVNIAQRIETLNDYFGSDILASEGTVLLAANEANIDYRMVEKIRLKGKSVDVSVVEILNHLPTAVRQQRLETDILIREGISLRNDGELQGAADHFAVLFEKYPEDKVILHHYMTSQKAMHDSNWNGIVSL